MTLPVPMGSKEQWVVEIRNSSGTWHNELNGPEVIYETEDAAMAWALKLKPVHQAVRIKHTVTGYLEV